MKGVLLHGGAGTRLRPLTHTGPKQLIPVAGKPISQYCLEDLKSIGIKEVALVLGDIWPDKVMEYYGDGSKLGLNLTYIRQGAPRGLAHAISLTEAFVGDEPFVVYLGDNLLKGGIKDQAQTFQTQRPDAMVLLSKVAEPQRFGVAKFNTNGKLEGLIEKPNPPPSPYALVGVYFFTPKIFAATKMLQPSQRGELEITDAIQTLLDNGSRVDHTFVQGWWKDTGTPEDILDANRLVLDDKLKETIIEGRVEEGAAIQGRVRIEKDAQVMKGTTLRGPAHIGSGTVIASGAHVGPYSSIGSACEIRGCEIGNSIVMDSCKVEAHCRILDSIIGPETQITDVEHGQPRGYRFVLGERSNLQV